MWLYAGGVRGTRPGTPGVGLAPRPRMGHLSCHSASDHASMLISWLGCMCAKCKVILQHTPTLEYTHVRSSNLHNLAHPVHRRAAAGAAGRRAAGAVGAAGGAGLGAVWRAMRWLGLGCADRADRRVVLRPEQYCECLAGRPAAGRVAVDRRRHAHVRWADGGAGGSSYETS